MPGEPWDLQRLVDACIDFLVDVPDGPVTESAVGAVRDLLAALWQLPPT